MVANEDLNRLVEILKRRGNRSAREKASRQLQYYGNAAVEKLGTLLMDSTGVIAETAAITLSGIGVSAIPALSKALREGGHGRRKYASLALANIGKAAIPVLQNATTDEDRGVRWRAFNALARIGGPSIPFIVTTLLEGDEETKLLIVQAIQWQMTRVDTPDLEQHDAEGNSVIPCLIQLLEQSDQALQSLGMGMLQKIGLPAINSLAEYVLDCNNEVAEKNCISTLNGIMFGCGARNSEVAGDILREYTSALFDKVTHITVTEVYLSAEDYGQALNSGDSRVWKERCLKEYRLLFGELGVLAVPVLAPVWLYGTKQEKEFSNQAMDSAFYDSCHIPHIPLRNPRDYEGPISPDDMLFSNVNPYLLDDVNKVVTALEYKYMNILDDTREERNATKQDSLMKHLPEMDSVEREQTSEEERAKLLKLSKIQDLVRERAIQTIRDSGVRMLPCILEMAQSGDDDRCLCALEALSIVDGIDTEILRNNLALLLVLIRFMKIPHLWYRMRAIAIASHIGQVLLPLLSEYTSSADELDKLAAVAAMGSIGTKALTYISRLTSDSNQAVAAFATWYVAMLTTGTYEEAPILRTGLGQY